MEKDIDIKITETKSVQSVSYEELYISLRDKFRIMIMILVETLENYYHMENKYKGFKILDKILLYLIYRRWKKLSGKIDGKTFLSSDTLKDENTMNP